MLQHSEYRNYFMKRIALACLVFLSISVNAQPLVAVIETERGVMKAELNDRAAPTTVANFVNLALRGFYDGLSFHRVERNFMAQGGDPRADGTGGPGYQFAGELLLKHNRQGVLSMANSGPGTDGSQFFITHMATPHLDGKHSVFGRVIDGLQIVLQIRRRDKIHSITIEGDPTELFRRRERQLVEWNAVLDQRFPGLRAAFLPR